MKKLFGRDKPKDQPLQPPVQQSPLITPIHQQFASRPISSADHEHWEVVDPQHTPPLPPGASPPVPSPTARSPSPYSVSVKSTSQQQTLRKKTPPVLGILHSLDPVQQPPLGHSRNKSEERPPEPAPKNKGGFWGRGDREREERDVREREQAREREREREHHRGREGPRERPDEGNELTRKIGFLTATASEDWTLVLDVCDHASATEANAKEAVRALRREFKYGEPAAQLAAARLWAIMLRNSSDTFISQSTSRKFLDTLEDLLTSSRTSPVVRERVMDVLAAAAYASGSKKDAGFRGLWRRVKPRDKPEEGMPFDTEDAMFNPPLAAQDNAVVAPPPMRKRKTSDSVAPGPNDVPPPHKPHRAHRHHIIPPDEDMRRLFQECKIGGGNALLLSQALAMATPERLEDGVIVEFHKKCIDSQELIFTQIEWGARVVSTQRSWMDCRVHSCILYLCNISFKFARLI
ncbi:hypothetical protein C8R47DRAFT_574276 [Mycena vitilis]|nr:hypothetical protein C8R47DRAFT_574276 [Mycena vitilis]